MATFDPFGYESDFQDVLNAIAALTKVVDSVKQEVSASLAAVSIEISSVANAQGAQGASLQGILSKQDAIMATLDDLVTDVGEETTTIASLSTFIQGLRDQISALPGLTAAQQSQIDGIFTSLESNKAALAAAMVANVPPAPAARQGA